jgi:hypothetical protein
LHFDPILARLEQRHADVFGQSNIPQATKQKINMLASAAMPVAKVLIAHSFEGLGGQSIRQVCEVEEIDASRIRRELTKNDALNPTELANKGPLRALATIGYARLIGILSAGRHDTVARSWLNELARSRFLSSTH